MRLPWSRGQGEDSIKAKSSSKHHIPVEEKSKNEDHMPQHLRHSPLQFCHQTNSVNLWSKYIELKHIWYTWHSRNVRLFISRKSLINYQYFSQLWTFWDFFFPFHKENSLFISEYFPFKLSFYKHFTTFFYILCPFQLLRSYKRREENKSKIGQERSSMQQACYQCHRPTPWMQESVSMHKSPTPVRHSRMNQTR